MAKSAPKRLKRPSDPIELAKLIGEQESAPTQDEVRRVMSALGKIGGPKGGAARAKSLSAERRKQIAVKAASARWKKRK